jgi:hypothetical protein
MEAKMDDQDTAIRQDALEFANSLDKLSHRDRVTKLVELLRKHAEVSKKPVDLIRSDFAEIVSSANKLWVNGSTPVEINKTKGGLDFEPLSAGEYKNLCVIEATVGYLNKLECLKKVPSFTKRY